MTESTLVDFLEAIILGIIQGLTEFLPISSSAHLRIIGDLAQWGDPGATFTAITQLGTETAVLIYFWKDITRIIGRWFRSFRSPSGSHAVAVPKDDPDVRLGWLIIIGTVPIVLAGFFLQDLIRDALRSLWITAFVLIGFGLLLWAADAFGRRVKELTDMGYRDGILIGFAQMLALIPGVSRSGASISAGLALGYTRPAAARFAFLLAVPAVFGSGFYELATSFREPGTNAYGFAETAVATLVAFAVGYAVIAFLMKYLEKRSFLPFVIYRILLGGTIIVLLSVGVLQPLAS